MSSIPSSTVQAPIAPVLSPAAFGWRRAGLPALSDVAAQRQVTSGRVALGLALRCAGIQPGDTVLMPAWHSLSMLGPVRDCGASVRFFGLASDTAPDLAQARSLLDPTVKALVVVHYFGFVQDLAPARALCDAHGLSLIEDCAHAWFGMRGGCPIGGSGDYAIGSSMKFFPIFEGGCLVSHRHRLPGALGGGGAGFEAKAALGALEAGFGHGRLPALRAALALPLHLKTALWNRVKARSKAGAGQVPAAALAPSSSDSSFEFDPRWLDRRSSWFSRAVLRRAGRARLVEGRRRHYLELERALAGAPGWQPLFAALPAGACPWVFPLLADHPEALFERLRDAGVPMVRFGASLWPGVDASVCANSAALGRRLFGLPVHQELRASERAWLAATVRRALEDAAGAAP